METAWIAVDWGTTNLRAWAVGPRGQTLARVDDAPGMNAAAGGNYEAALLQVIGDWLQPDGKTQIVACGMIGARQGWVEAPYVDAPMSLTDLAKHALRPETSDARLDVLILPGVAQRDEDAPDVMRGEETQLLGIAALHSPRSTICLPGTHSKWAKVDGSRLESFTTYMTGEIYGLLADVSVLRFSVRDGGEDREVFLEAVKRGVERPHRLLSDVFRVRAADLLHDAGPSRSRARLSGLLIGSEIGSVLQEQKPDEPVVLVGHDRLGNLYASALRSQGFEVEVIGAEDAVLAGLREARQVLVAA